MISLDKSKQKCKQTADKYWEELIIQINVNKQLIIEVNNIPVGYVDISSTPIDIQSSHMVVFSNGCTMNMNSWSHGFNPYT